VVRSVGSARDQTKDVTRMFLARSRVRLGPMTPGNHRFSPTGSDGGMFLSDQNRLFPSPRGKASPRTHMNSRNQIGGARQSWSGAGPVPQFYQYQSPESLAGHSELPRLDDFTPGAPLPANYSLLSTHPIDDSLHTVRASQSKGQGGEQPRLGPYVQENALGISVPRTPGYVDLKRVPNRYRGDTKDVEEVPHPFQQVDSMPPSLSTSQTDRLGRQMGAPEGNWRWHSSQSSLVSPLASTSTYPVPQLTAVTTSMSTPESNFIYGNVARGFLDIDPRNLEDQVTPHGSKVSSHYGGYSV